MYYGFHDTWISPENALIWTFEMINNASSKRIYMETCGPKHLELTHLQSTKTLPKAWPWPCMFSSQKNYVFPECGCELPWASSRCACVRVAPAFAARAAQRSMRLSKHGMAAGARSQGWGQEEGMRLGGNKSKFLWNDLTGNDRVSALYNHTAREREGGRSSS